MKWRNHMLMSGSIAVLCGFSPLAVAYCAGASALPDQLETIGPIRIIPHRTITHELGLWLAGIALGAWFPFLEHLPPLLAATLCGMRFRSWMLFLPGVLHLAGDAMTPGGVRVFGRKLALGLFRTGEPVEYVVAFVFAVAAGIDIYFIVPDVLDRVSMIKAKFFGSFQ